jgi:arylsulfatase
MVKMHIAPVLVLVAAFSMMPVGVLAQTSRPHIVLILTDNLGYGELGSYGGGITRGVGTPSIDSLAKDGMRFLNFNMEVQCTPARSSLFTGRFAIRSGTHSVPFGGVYDGLTQWEVTLGEALSDAGYATGYYGKWHLGSNNGRLPNDQGFDEWFGIPRTTEEALWFASPGWSAAIMPPTQMMEGKRGEKSRMLGEYDLTQRRLIDAEITRRSVGFIGKQAGSGKPMFVVVALTQPHLPTEPNPAFKGRTGNGDWADTLAEMDANVGQILDAVDKAGIRDNTIVIFTSDNGAEYIRPWQGWAGPWRGAYFTALEGGLRVPTMIRWPGKVPAGRVSNEIVHGVDMFATMARLTGAKVPTDRPIDSLDQSYFILGKTEKSAREGFPIWVSDRLQAVKWRNWKVHFFRQDTMFDPPARVGVPLLYNLYTDPREENNSIDSWVVGPVLRIVGEFEQSVKQHPLIPMGTPDPFRPATAPQ